MEPIEVSVDVPQRREDVFDFLDVLANHEPFTDHMLVDWTCSGPAHGVGSKVKMRAKAPGKAQWMEMTAITSKRPRRTVEESVGAGGRRRTRGTYTLEERPDGGTAIHFKLEYLQVPAGERVLAPLIRMRMKRDLAKAMVRLSETLASLPPSAQAA
jgi:hypothetical protein